MEIHDVTLEGDRIRLRPFTVCDLPVALEWHQDPRVMAVDHPGRRNPPMMEEVAAIYDYESRHGLLFIIERRARVPIGEVCLERMNLERGLQPGKQVVRFPILIDPKEWGRGYAKEAMRLLLPYAFLIMRADVACAMDVAVENARSQALWRSLGFRASRLLTPPEHGVDRPVIDYSITREEWAGRAAAGHGRP